MGVFTFIFVLLSIKINYIIHVFIDPVLLASVLYYIYLIMTT